MRIFTLTAMVIALLGGCSTYGTRPQDIRPEANFMPVAVVKTSYSPGSLWPGETTGNSLFADKKARYVNDIITIVIDESSSGQNQTSTNSSRDTKTNAGISALLGLDAQIISANPTMGPTLSVAGTQANSLKGTGDTSRGGKLQATITAKVVRVLDNGNILIEGRRQLTLNEEDQFIVMTGIIRPDDITTDNQISSSQIADARIVYTGKGVLNDKQRPGWMTRILDWGWPF
jgi:flagellar L-ring protein FlgH